MIQTCMLQSETMKGIKKMIEFRHVSLAVMMTTAWSLCGTAAIVDLGGETKEIGSDYFAELVVEYGEEIVITNGTLKSNGFSNLALPSASVTLASGVVWEGDTLELGAAEGETFSLKLDKATMNFSGSIAIARSISNGKAANQMASTFKISAANASTINCSSLQLSSTSEQIPGSAILLEVKNSTMNVAQLYADKAAESVVIKFASATLNVGDNGINMRSTASAEIELSGRNVLVMSGDFTFNIPLSGTGTLLVNGSDAGEVPTLTYPGICCSGLAASSTAKIKFNTLPTGFVAGEDWKSDNVPAGYDWEYMAPNGYPYWMNYAMNIEPSDPTNKLLLMFDNARSTAETVCFCVTSNADTSRKLNISNSIMSNSESVKFSLLTASSPCGPFTEYDVSAAKYVSNLGMYIKMPNPTVQSEFYKVKLEFKR